MSVFIMWMIGQADNSSSYTTGGSRIWSWGGGVAQNLTPQKEAGFFVVRGGCLSFGGGPQAKSGKQKKPKWPRGGVYQGGHRHFEFDQPPRTLWPVVGHFDASDALIIGFSDYTGILAFLVIHKTWWTYSLEPEV